MSPTDLIVVGGGSAGCVLAARLAREYGFRITLIEAPPRTGTAPTSEIDRQRPARWLNLLGSSDDWDLHTEPCVALAGRRLAWPRGRGPGGSNRINAMIWFPPTDHDLRMLADASDQRWNVDQCVVAYESTRALVRPQAPLWLSESSNRFIETASGFGDGVPMIYQRVNRRGRRWNPARLLDRIDHPRGRVTIARATVDRVNWDRQRAVGVRIRDQNASIDLRATHGVVLCAGAIATPTILIRSGIGPADELARHGIDMHEQHDSVGQNLQDHLIMPVVFGTKSTSPLNINSSMRDIVRWQTLGTGPIGSNIAECGGLFRDQAIQIHVTPTNYLTFPTTPASAAMTIGVNVTQPASRGSIGLRSRELGDPPLIHSQYLSAEQDLHGTIQGIRLAREFAASMPLADWITTEILPGCRRESDESIAKSIARYALTLYHPVGTCRMGPSPETAVDPEFKVRNTEGLWIADASTLPALTIGNPNATVMTVATMAADSIQQRISD